MTRRWDTGKGEYNFTALGTAYYSTLRRNYVVDVPIAIKGKRKNGTEYTVRSHVKMEKLGMRPVEVPLHLNLDQRRAFIRREVERKMNKTIDAIFRISDEEWWYDDEGSWAVHEETVGVDPETGEGEAHVILDRRVKGKPLVNNTLLLADSIHM